MKTLLLLFLGLSIRAWSQPVEYSATQAAWRINVDAHYPEAPDWQGSARSYRLLDAQIAQHIDEAENTRERGVAYLKHGDYDQAVHFYERACQLDPRHHGYTGWVYLEYMRDYPRALRHLELYDSLTVSPHDVVGDHPVQFLKGRAYAQMGNYHRAIDLYSLAIGRIETSVGAEWVNYLYYIARDVAYQNTKQFSLALADFDKAVKNNPQRAMANYHRGRTLHQLGRLPDAKTAYREAQFFLNTRPTERDVYFEHFDAVYEPEIEAALSALNAKP